MISLRDSRVAGSSTITYSYQGLNILYEKNVTGSTTTITKHFYADGLQVAKMVGTGVYYLHPDALGSTRLVVTSTLTVKFSSNYVPYGPNYALTGKEVFMYTGKPYDAATGLYYYGARFYDPTTGRFVTEDSNNGMLSDPMSLNRYAYARDNPMKYEDPSGNAFVEEVNGLRLSEVTVSPLYVALSLARQEETDTDDLPSPAETRTPPPHAVKAPGGGGPDQTSMTTTTTITGASMQSLTFQQQMNLAGVSGTSFYGGVPGSDVGTPQSVTGQCLTRAGEGIDYSLSTDTGIAVGEIVAGELGIEVTATAAAISVSTLGLGLPLVIVAWVVYAEVNNVQCDS
jgi:RHS repeat-associated protein